MSDPVTDTTIEPKDTDYLEWIRTHIQMIDSYLNNIKLNPTNIVSIIEAKGELVRLNKKIDKIENLK